MVYLYIRSLQTGVAWVLVPEFVNPSNFSLQILITWVFVPEPIISLMWLWLADVASIDQKKKMMTQILWHKWPLPLMKPVFEKMTKIPSSSLPFFIHFHSQKSASNTFIFIVLPLPCFFNSKYQNFHKSNLSTYSYTVIFLVLSGISYIGGSVFLRLYLPRCRLILLNLVSVAVLTTSVVRLHRSSGLQRFEKFGKKEITDCLMINKARYLR